MRGRAIVCVWPVGGEGGGGAPGMPGGGDNSELGTSVEISFETAHGSQTGIYFYHK